MTTEADTEEQELAHAYEQAELWQRRYQRMKHWIKFQYTMRRKFQREHPKWKIERADPLAILMDAAHAAKNIERYELEQLQKQAAQIGEGDPLKSLLLEEDSQRDGS